MDMGEPIPSPGYLVSARPVYRQRNRSRPRSDTTHSLSSGTARNVSIVSALPGAESLQRIQREKEYCTSAVHGRIINVSRHQTLYCKRNLSVQKERGKGLRRKCNGPVAPGRREQTQPRHHRRTYPESQSVALVQI